MQPSPVQTAPTDAGSGGGRANKKTKAAPVPTAPAVTPLTPGGKKIKPITLPLIKDEPALGLRIPELSPAGQLLSQLMAAKATRIDDEHVQMQEMKIDLYHPDGKEDFHVTMPTSIFNLTTRIITSEDPVVVQTQDFELTGEKMEFNTVERTGKLIGKVRMIIHNLKQVAGGPDPTPKPE